MLSTVPTHNYDFSTSWNWIQSLYHHVCFFWTVLCFCKLLNIWHITGIVLITYILFCWWAGSLLVAASHFGGYVLGSDIDFLMLHGKTRPTRIQAKVRIYIGSVQWIGIKIQDEAVLRVCIWSHAETYMFSHWLFALEVQVQSQDISIQ
jgi:hypothetical protein